MHLIAKYFLISTIGIICIKPAFCIDSSKSKLESFNYESNYEKSKLNNVIEVKNRNKRSDDDFSNKISNIATEVGANIFGKLMEATNEGYAVKDKRDKSVNVFGTKVENKHDLKAGHGDAMNDPIDDSDEDEKKRKKRSPCRRRRTTPATNATENAEVADDNVNEAEGRRRRNRNGKNKSNFIESFMNRFKRETSTKTDEKPIDKKTEETVGIMKRITESIQKMWQNIAEMFNKLGKKLSGGNNSSSTQAEQA